MQSDERLAELALDGHDAAFAAIVDRYRAALLRYCAGIVGPTRAEDAVQQALINAHAALMRTTEVRHLRSWLYRIAHNSSLNVLRSVRDDIPLDASQAAISDGPEAAFERAERLHETLAAVRELPERQRAALLLRELEGRSHEEIATALGVTKGSARQNLMRARVAVRGAVSAVTPYPLLVKLASALASSPAAGGWGDVAATAGAGATIAKLTAGVMATGALVGGAVGTQQVVHHDPPPPAAAAAHAAPARSPAASTPAAAPVERRAAFLSSAASRSTTSAGTRRAGARKKAGSGSGKTGARSGRGGQGATGVSGSAGGDDSSRDDGDDIRHDDASGRGRSGSSGRGASGDDSRGSDDGSSSGDDLSTSGSGSGGKGSVDDPAKTEGTRDSSGGRDGGRLSGSDDDKVVTTPSPVPSSEGTPPLTTTTSSPETPPDDRSGSSRPPGSRDD